MAFVRSGRQAADLILPGACAVAENLIPEEGALRYPSGFPSTSSARKLIRGAEPAAGIHLGQHLGPARSARTVKFRKISGRSRPDRRPFARRTSYAQASSIIRVGLRRSERNPPVSDDRNENPNALCRRRYAGTRPANVNQQHYFDAGKSDFPPRARHEAHVNRGLISGLDPHRLPGQIGWKTRSSSRHARRPDRS